MQSNELQKIIAFFRSLPKLEDLTPQEQRANMEASVAGRTHLPPDVKCTPVTAGGVPAEWVETGASAPERVVYYLHGGGYVGGSVNTHREAVAGFARAAQARVLLLDYRLAPENPFPAAVEDAVSGYQWLLKQGIAPNMIVIAGESAGGGLTVAALVALKERGLPLPAAAVAMSPWVDMACTGASMESRKELDPMVQQEGLLRMAGHYLGGADPRHPLASPLYADLSGLPPLLIQVGTAETLYDDAARLAEQAREAGVNVTFEPWEDMIHMWHSFAAVLPEGQQAIERVGEFVLEYTGEHE
jgi:acetyl esterase/lipase